MVTLSRVPSKVSVVSKTSPQGTPDEENIMSANTAPIKAKDFVWETFDGETTGYSMDHDYEISVSARPTAKDVRWGAIDSPERTWTVYEGASQELATGVAKDLRAAKTAALAAINTHRS